MVKQDLLIQSKGIPVFGKSLLSLLLLFIFNFSAIGQSQIVCNDNVQVSLDGSCQAVVRPDMILEGPQGTYAPPFRIRISGTGILNNNTNAPIVTAVGNYTVTVTNSQGNSCWGTLKVEDKLAPVVSNCACPEGNDNPACAFLCTNEAAFFAGTFTYPRPAVADACTAVTTTFSDHVEVLGANGCLGKRVIRKWVFTDAYGNKNEECTSEYRFLPANIADVQLPAPYNAPQLTCKSDVSMTGIFNFYRDKLYTEYRPSYVAGVPGTYATVAIAEAAALRAAIAEANRYAYPTINGVPINGTVCNIMAAKADTELVACNPACSNSKKVIRLWTILDWCNSDTRTLTQVIKATDEEDPTIVAKDITVSVDPWSCEANFLLPLPEVLHDNCDANPKYSVQVPAGVGVRLDVASNRYLITGAPKGVHSFTYVATDCCENEGLAEITVTVVDKTAPVAVAKQFIVISLTTGGQNDGIAKLFANSVDNGSYDSCTPVHLEIRREDDPVRDNDGCEYTGNKTYNADGHPQDGSTNPTSPNFDDDNGAFVKFCCEDITNTEGPVPFGIVKVWMRVWDDGDMNGVYGSAGDNYNETWVEVRVEDKLTPQIVCPPTVRIKCDDDCHDLSLTGEARAFSNCLDLEVEYTDREFLTQCNVGRIERTWRIKNRPSIICTQTIFKDDVASPFGPNSITWPKRDVTTDCATDVANIKPTWVAGPCDIIGLSLKSDTFYFEGNACMKILNKWTVINWCTYDPNSTTPTGYYTETQVVKVIDEQKPVLGSCTDRMFEIDDHNDSDSDGNKCETRNLMLTMTATDQGQCASDWLKWIVFVDLWADGSNDYEYSSFLPSTDATFNDSNGNGVKDRYVAATGQGGEVKVTIPEDIVGSMSNHKITWRVVDGCGNVTSCTQNFMVVDKKKPTPYCLNISSALMQNGKVELWAADFNVGSFDNCTAQRNLLYTFNEANPVLSKINQQHFFKGNGLNATEAEYNAGNAQKWLPASKSSGMVFDCNDLPSVDVKMTVWDEKLNYDFCVVRLDLADNQGACGNTFTSKVSGKLVTSAGKQIENAEVTLDNGKPEMISSTTSTVAGYNFNNATMYYNYNVTSSKTGDYLNGVSTLDLVMIQRHVLGISKLANPFDVIASDINNDTKVTASDLVELRKLILGIYSELPKNQSWRFVNGAAPFTDASNPFPFNEAITINNLSHDVANQDFIAVKIGDVNGSAIANSNDTDTETRSTVVLNATNASLKAGESHAVVLNTEADEVYGLQFTLNVNNADLVDIYVGNQKLSDANIAKISDNTYTVSWNDVNAISKELITINLVAQTNANTSELININSSATRAEMYTSNNLNIGKLSLRFANEGASTFELYQNEPNPFTDKTNIMFNLPEAGIATLKVMDVNGKVIYTNNGSFGKGMNTFTIQRNDLPGTGVMIYQIESGANTATKKMIGLE